MTNPKDAEIPTKACGDALIASNRMVWLDVLKGIAILAVVLYHADFQKYGYLGVDIFLVVGGYLTAKSLMRRDLSLKFSYFRFLSRQVLRFWPLVLVASLVSLIVGYYSMLPDDYENLAESVIASNCFANNILSAITTKNYWDVSNSYKPLMHMWYLGALLQSYVFFSMIPFVVKKFTKNVKICGHIFALFTFVSFILCLCPVFSRAQRFYYFPFRFFELSLGGLIFCYTDGDSSRTCQISKGEKRAMILICILLFLLLYPLPILSDFLRLTSVCLLTACIITITAQTKNMLSENILLRLLSLLGKFTFSIFVWHQVLLAFIRYTWTSHFSWNSVIFYVSVLCVLVFLSWNYIEKPTRKMMKEKQRALIACCVVLFIITNGFALHLYLNAGVVRDVPELDVSRDNVHRNMHAEYCDRGYSFDKDFSDGAGIKILVIGNSFARDWINILLESKIASKIQISYISSYPLLKGYEEKKSRFEKADYIFYALSDNKFTEIPEPLNDFYRGGNVYIVGNKNFGENNGQIYAHRKNPHYFESSVLLPESYYVQNDILKQRFGNKYVDMITPVQLADKSVRVFSENHKYISQDCRHLTRGGAEYYASILDLEWLI